MLGYFFQSKLIYFPTRELRDTPASAGMAFSDVELRASDGVRLHAWHVPARGPSRGTVIFCHGNAGNIGDRVEEIGPLHEMGLDILIFDYRGYGRSEGRPTEAGTYLDAEAAWDWLTREKRVPADRIVIFGRSLGGAVAAHLAASRNPRALILESTFTSIPDVGAELYPFLPVRLIARFRYATAEYVKSVRCPVLVAHGLEDEMIPCAHGRKIFAAAPEPKEFLEFHGGHNEGWYESGIAYTNGLKSFLDKHLR